MAGARGANVLVPPTPWLVAWFTRYVRRYVARSFHAVRAGGAASLPRGDAPVVVYCNHPSWWDPLTCALLATTYLAERDHWGLIEAGQLERYRFFARLGFVGIEPGTTRGARRLLDVARALGARDGATLWLTPEGRFADPRERPHRLAAGLVGLARHVPHARFVPLALEYPFGEERLPEVRALFGKPLCPGALPDAGPEDLGARLSGRLSETADRLAALTIARDGARAGTRVGRRSEAPGGTRSGAVARSPSGASRAESGEGGIGATHEAPGPDVETGETLETVLVGGSGVGGVYDLWRRGRAALRGERFHAAHGAGRS